MRQLYIKPQVTVTRYEYKKPGDILHRLEKAADIKKTKSELL
jgi:hypothetical protein